MTTQGQLGAATTRWSDYVGTAAADDAAAVAGNASVYELAGLDRDRWLVVAVDIEVLDGELGVVIYAVDRSIGGGDPASFDVDEVIAEQGHLPVRAIRLTRSAETQPFLDQIFRRVAIRLVARSFRDDVIVVQDEQDEQDA
jgi:hypothetical protein